MKLQGKVINWNDDKGFGFVEPNDGGDHAFVHIKAFSSRSRRPVNGDNITYELVRDNHNRYKAENIKFAFAASSSNNRHNKTSDGSVGIVLIMLFLTGLFAAVFFNKLSIIIAGLYLLMSTIAFITYALDKSAAQKGRWRTKESTLHLYSLFGGWPGAFIAQTILRHKSKKEEFKRVYWITVLLNLAGLCWLYTENGTNFLNSAIVLFMHF